MNFYFKCSFLLLIVILGFGVNISTAFGGTCGSTHYNCASGTSSNSSSGGCTDGLIYRWFWNCDSTTCAETSPMCGTANGGSFSSLSSSDTTLCYTCNGTQQFSSANFTATSNGWTWTCNGYSNYIYTPVNCSANKIINGTCGSSNGSNFSSAPTTNLCSAGTASSVSGTGPWTWTCSGINGGTTANCSANLIQNGQCGTANLKTYAYSITTYGSDTQCAIGTSTNTAFPAQGSIEGWYCSGLYGGTTSDLCAASRDDAPVNGQCGTANLKTYAYDVGSYGADTQCTLGTSTNTAFPAQGSIEGWYCSGLYGGTTSDLCAASRDDPPAVNGTCGSSNGSNFSAAPATNLCSTGSASSVSGTGPWTWVCSGINGGTTANCSANLIINGACGTSNGATVSTAPVANLCSVGTATAVTGTGPWAWTCTGSNGGTTADCSASVASGSANGVCGSANTQAYAYNIESYGSDAQCSIGTSTNTAFPAQGVTVNWYCTGINGGSQSAQCSASRDNPPIVNGDCGSADGGTVSTTPTTNLCSVGTATAVTGTGPWAWTCVGSGGGTTDSCNANDVSSNLDGVCGSANTQTYASNIENYGSDAQCSTGTSTNTAFPAQGVTVNWYCTGVNSGNQSTQCSASRSASPVNGVCGPAAKTYSYFATVYEGVQCTAGTASDTTFPAAGATKTWVCTGANGGTDSGECKAIHLNVNPKWVEK
ncbi:MAG: hypothetical protein WCX74_04325 [Candidatus Paceibacterota bacterium]